MKQILVWKFSCLYTVQSIRYPKIIFFLWTKQAIQGLQNTIICLQKYSLKQCSLKWTLNQFLTCISRFCSVSEEKSLPGAETTAWLPWLMVPGVCMQQQFWYRWCSSVKTHNWVWHKGTELDMQSSPKLCSYYAAASLIAEHNFFRWDTVYMRILPSQISNAKFLIFRNGLGSCVFFQWQQRASSLYSPYD